MDHLNNHIELVTGKIQKVYALDKTGTRINDIDQLDNAKGYVLVANDDPYISIRYNTKAISISHSGPHGLAGYTTNNEHMSRIRKVTERWPKDRSFNNSVNQQQLDEAAASRKSSTRKKSAPKQVPKTPEPPRKSLVTEAIGTDAIEEKRFDSDTEEVYGETLVKHLSSENTKTPRTPTVPKSKPLTPSPLKKESSQELLKSGVVSPKSVARSEVVSAKSALRSEVASPKSNIRSQIASPKSDVRSTTAKSERSEIQENIDSEPEISASSRAESPAIDSPKSKRSSKADLKSASKSELKVGAREIKTPAPPKSNKGSEPSLVKSKSSLAKGSNRELTKPKTPADL